MYKSAIVPVDYEIHVAPDDRLRNYIPSTEEGALGAIKETKNKEKNQDSLQEKGVFF